MNTRLPLLALLASLAIAGTARGQSTSPNCNLRNVFTNAGANEVYDNRHTLCTAWQVSYVAAGYSSITIELDSAPDVNGAPGAWTQVLSLSSPSGASGQWIGTASWLRIFITTAVGSGNITVIAGGYLQNPAVSSGSKLSASDPTGTSCANPTYAIIFSGNIYTCQGGTFQIYQPGASAGNQPPLIANSNPLGNTCTVTDVALIYAGTVYACISGTYQFYATVVLQSGSPGGTACTSIANPPMIQDASGNIFTCKANLYVVYAPQPVLVAGSSPAGAACTVTGTIQIYAGVAYACSGGTYKFYGAVTLQTATPNGLSCAGVTNPPLIQDNNGNLFSCQTGVYVSVVNPLIGAIGAVISGTNPTGQTCTNQTFALVYNGVIYTCQGTAYVPLSAVAYNQGSAQAITQSTTQKLQQTINIADFTAADGLPCGGNPSHDDTLCVINAINYATANNIGLNCSTQFYISSHLTMTQGLQIFGQTIGNPSAGSVGCGFTSSNPLDDIFQLNANISNTWLENIQFNHGRNAINLLGNSYSFSIMRNLMWAGQANAGFAGANTVPIQSNKFEFIYQSGGPYCFDVTATNSGSQTFAANYLNQITCQGEFFLDQKGISNNNIWNMYRGNGFSGPGYPPASFVLAGTFVDNIMIEPSFETHVSACKNNITTFTGSIASGSTSATLTNATGFATGDVVTIQGAGCAGCGNNGWDFVTGPITLAGSVASWTAPTTTTTLATAEVTNNTCDEIVLQAGAQGGGPGDLKIFGGQLGLNLVRYGLNGNGYQFKLIGVQAPSRPVYDPYANAGLEFSDNVNWRTANLAFNASNVSTSPQVQSYNLNTIHPTVFMGNPAAGMAWVGCGSAGNILSGCTATGPWGKLHIVPKKVNGYDIAYFDWDTGNFAMNPVNTSSFGGNISIGTSTYNSALNNLILKTGTPPAGGTTGQGHLYACGTTPVNLCFVNQAGTSYQLTPLNNGLNAPVYVDLTGQTAIIGSTAFPAVPGKKCFITYNALITTAAGTSSAIGANGLSITYTNGTTGTLTNTTLPAFNAGQIVTTGGSSANTVGTNVSGSGWIYTNGGTPNYSFSGYTSVPANSMVYELHIVLTSQ